eukprot:2686987-Pyramimonas_sp.AAC.1
MPEHRNKIVPLALYLDKVPYTDDESSLAIAVHLLSTGKRHLVAVIRVSDMCDCGCSHWCSYFPIYSAIAWSLGALVNGEYPSARHDQKDWNECDVERRTLGGQERQ